MSVACSLALLLCLPAAAEPSPDSSAAARRFAPALRIHRGAAEALDVGNRLARIDLLDLEGAVRGTLEERGGADGVARFALPREAVEGMLVLRLRVDP